MRRILGFLKPYSPLIAGAVALLAVEAICALVLPGMMADIVNDGVLPGNIALIRSRGAAMLLVTLVGVVAAVSMGFLGARVATGAGCDLRSAVFRKVLAIPNAEMDRFATSSLITRTTNDITQIQSTLIMALRQFVYAPIIGIGGIIRALDRSPSMTWIIALATLVMVGVMAILLVAVMPKYKKVQTLIDRLNLVSRENLGGILVVRAFGTQEFERKRFAKANRELARTNLFVDQAFSFMLPSINLIMNLTTALIVWIGARQASAFRVDIGDIFAFLQYGMLIIFAFLMVAVMFVLLPRAVVSAESIREVLESRSDPPREFTPLPPGFRGAVEFRDVTFRYPDASADDDAVLEGISFSVSPGETVAIIGSTGSGKTTILKLLLRFHDPTSGAVLLDGIDACDIRREELHGMIGYVPQKAQPFAGTIRSNLLYADRGAGEERMTEAAKTAQAAAFIEGKPDGYDHAVAQGGANLSGGQRQRLSIARALVKGAPILVLDDSFSALDLKTDAMLRAALREKADGVSMLVVAQRVSTIMGADRILVLERGRIAGLGTHAHLMETCEVYRGIAASQLSEEELRS